MDDEAFERLLDDALLDLKPGQARVLREMRVALADERIEDSELIVSGLHAYLGTRRVSARTVHALLRGCCIASPDDFSENRTRYYHITGTGLEMLLRYELANRVSGGAG